MAKTVVTHVNPDLDAIGAVWFLKRFGGDDFKYAEVKFVPAGERLEDEDNNTVHVDTGLGRFDHHQEERGLKNTSATKLVYEWLVREKRIVDEEELRRIVDLINDIDHFKEYFWPEPVDDRYLFCFEHVLHGIKMGNFVKNDRELVELGMMGLDGILITFKIRVKAEEDIGKGVSFETKWGDTLAIESSNSGIAKLALKMGFKVVIRKDPELGTVRIKAAPLKNIDLSPVYEKLKKQDEEASWFLHPGKKMVLNGSIRNPKMVPSKLPLDKVIEILKSC